jgi:hypothetical protein
MLWFIQNSLFFRASFAELFSTQSDSKKKCFTNAQSNPIMPYHSRQGQGAWHHKWTALRERCFGVHYFQCVFLSDCYGICYIFSIFISLICRILVGITFHWTRFIGMLHLNVQSGLDLFSGANFGIERRWIEWQLEPNWAMAGKRNDFEACFEVERHWKREIV